MQYLILVLVLHLQCCTSYYSKNNLRSNAFYSPGPCTQSVHTTRPPRGSSNQTCRASCACAEQCRTSNEITSCSGSNASKKKPVCTSSKRRICKNSYQKVCFTQNQQNDPVITVEPAFKRSRGKRSIDLGRIFRAKKKLLRLIFGRKRRTLLRPSWPSRPIQPPATNRPPIINPPFVRPLPTPTIPSSIRPPTPTRPPTSVTAQPPNDDAKQNCVLAPRWTCEWKQFNQSCATDEPMHG